MKLINQFAVQNYVVMPTSMEVQRTPFPPIESNPKLKAKLVDPPLLTRIDEKWHITLSGVAIVDEKATSMNKWTYETLHIFPDIHSPVQYALNNFNLSIPPNIPYDVRGTGGIAYLFNVEQYTIMAALGSIFKQEASTNAGFAVNKWEPAPFKKLDGNDNAPTLNRIFDGIYVDIATKGAATLHRVNFQITLLGKIVFANSTVF